jgi:predicted unusual protein kinase regulating ubiquinone biosynthesis (AarF/ABC1/UbiB family)
MLRPFDNAELPEDWPASGLGWNGTSAELEEDPYYDADGDGKAWRDRMRRREKIQRAVDVATEQWLALQDIEIDEGERLDVEGALYQNLPRPNSLGVVKENRPALPPPRRQVTFEAGIPASVAKLFIWIWGAWRFFLGTFIDKLRHRDSQERRAVRLRETFERLGITFIKIGQQLSMRLDLIPYAYTRELENMLHNVPSMSADEAIETIERTTKRRLHEIFEAFDPDPIGSASVACVYQAVLKSGERVAVKVRRPHIGEDLASDMRALQWLLKISELVFLRPGFTVNLAFELRTMLMEELDFVREARFNEIFRRRTRKTKQLRFVSAPKVFFDHSNSEVLVTEFISGVWLHELLSALETDDKAALAKIEEMKIDPLILARRIQLIARFNNFENIFFHADLHPANILIQPGNKIRLIDFGSCGSFNRKELASWRRWFDAQSVNDVGGMVQAALGILEPLPPIDRDTFAMRMEMMFWNDLYALKSKHSDWTERISARLWMGFLELSREFDVPMRLNTLRMIRASMLADTIAARLDHDQDPYKEFRYYEKGAGRRAKKRAFRRVRRLTGPAKFLRIESAIESALKTVYRVQRAVDSITSINIIPLIGKASDVIHQIFKLVLQLSALAGIWTTGEFLYQYVEWRYRGGPVPQRLLQIIIAVLTEDRTYEIATLVPILNAARKIYHRLKDRDYGHPRGDSGGLL